MKHRILIAYYSRRGPNYVGGRVVDLPQGNTEVAAHLIQDLVGGETFALETVKDYPADYHATTEVAQQELRERARPELAGTPGDLSALDLVFLGYPNWWGTMPMAVLTFLEAHDFKGKTILPFCTHEGSGLGRSESDLRRACPGARVLKGLGIRGAQVQASGPEIRAWLQRSGVLA